MSLEPAMLRQCFLGKGVIRTILNKMAMIPINFDTDVHTCLEYIFSPLQRNRSWVFRIEMINSVMLWYKNDVFFARFESGSSNFKGC